MRDAGMTWGLVRIRLLSFLFRYSYRCGRHVSGQNPKLTQPETVSRFETVRMLRSSKALALGEAAHEQPRYPRTRKSYGNRHRTACLRNARSGKARWSSGQPIQKVCLQD